MLALACDRIVERGDGFDFADVLVDDLATHAIVDQAGVRWSNGEHRADHQTLNRVPDGPWVTQASFVSCCATHD